MAQTTGIINASSIRVFLDTDGDIATPAYVVVDHVTECSISVSVDMRDITTKTSQGFRESLPGLRSASLSLSGLFAEDATEGYNNLIAAQLAGDKVAVKITNVGNTGGYAGGSGDGGNVGDEEFTFNGYITSLEQSAGVEDNVGFSATIESDGTVARAAITA